MPTDGDGGRSGGRTSPVAPSTARATRSSDRLSALEHARDELDSVARRRGTHARFIADAVLNGDPVSPHTLQEYGDLVSRDRDARGRWRTAFDDWSSSSTASSADPSVHAGSEGAAEHREGEPCTTVRLPHRPGTADPARSAMAQQLRDAGLPPDVVTDAEIVLTELVHNALEHGRPLDDDDSLDVSWCVRGGRLRLCVVDGGRLSDLQVLRMNDSSLQGRGLAIVDRLSLSWAYDNGRGTRAFAELRTA